MSRDRQAGARVRRLRALWLLAAVADACGGEWGATEAQLPQRGTKSWAVLPRAGLTTYTSPC